MGECNFQYADELTSRTRLLLGDKAVEKLADMRVIIFGVGGVGSWCAESLVRTGIGKLTIVDSDCVSPTNLNRQLMATVDTIGTSKVEALKQRLLSISPCAEIDARSEIYSPETAGGFDLENYDYVVDAIDSLSNKAALILHATSLKGVRLVSSMGAALKVDPAAVKTAEFWNVKGCPLARALRQRFKRSGMMPRRKFKCVYSDELLPNLGSDSSDSPASQWDAAKAQINGSLVHITAIFGFTLAGLIVEETYRSAIRSQSENND